MTIRRFPLETRLGSAVFAALLACAGSAGAQPVEPDALSAWTLERSPERCVVSRRFGSTRDPVMLGFKAPTYGDALQIVVLRSGHRTRIEQVGATLAIDAHDVKTTALSYPLDARGRRVAHLLNVSGDESSRLRKAATLEIRIKEGVNRAFALAPMADAWVQLDFCLRRLRQTWNLEGASTTGIATPPEPLVPLRQLLNSEDYPMSAFWENQSGATGVVLLVDETGMVKDCTLTETSGVATLDARTCGLLAARARFKPALDRDGRPAKYAVRSRIVFVIS